MTYYSDLVLDQPATLHLHTWAGKRAYKIRLTGETRTKLCFEALEDIPMPHRRWLRAGEHGRAPKEAVTSNADGKRTL